MTDSERREAFDGGLRRLPLPKDRGGFSLPYWQERRRGEGLRDALENASSGGGFIYPENEHFLYGVAS